METMENTKKGNVENDTKEKTYEDNTKTIIPDGGWGWIVCLACLFANFACGGPALAYGIILPELKKYFKEGVFIISLIGSVLSTIGFAVAPIAAILMNKLSLRTVYILGSVWFSLSVLASSFSTSPYVLLITYGIIAGIGSGLQQLPATIGCNYYFEKKRALANGIAKTGISLSIFVYPPMTDLVLEKFDWKAVMYLYASIISLGIFLGAMIKPLNSKNRDQEAQFDKASIEQKSSTNQDKSKSIIEKSPWYHPSIWLFTMHRMLGNMTFRLFMMFIPILLIDLGFTLTQASLIVMVSGITNTISRVISGSIMDHRRINNFILISTGLIIQAILLCIYPFCNKFIILIILSGIGGFLIAPFHIGMAIVLGELLPIEKVASVSGLMSLAQGMGNLVGPPLAGYIYDHSGDHSIIFYIVATGYILSAISCWLAGYLYKRRKI